MSAEQLEPPEPDSFVQARMAYWRSLEPDREQADALASRWIAAARIRRRSGVWQWWRSAVSIAACLMIGFAIGWVGHEHRHEALSARPPETKMNLCQVALKDPDGQVTAVQTFDSMEKAREFAHDVAHWQEQEIQIQRGKPVILADRF